MFIDRALGDQRGSLSSLAEHLELWASMRGKHVFKGRVSSHSKDQSKPHVEATSYPNGIQWPKIMCFSEGKILPSENLLIKRVYTTTERVSEKAKKGQKN